MQLARCNNIADLRRMAKQRLPAPMFHYIDGGSDDEWSLRRNTTAFDDYELLPNYLRDISAIDTGTTLLGQKISWPVFLAPTGMSRLFHHEAEPAVAENFRKSAEGALNQLNGLLGASDFALGASPSLVDVALYATVWQTEDGKIDISGLANILAWKKRVEALPGFGMPRDVLFKEDHDA